MLELKNIKKDYISGNETVHALKGISLSFRKNEFVSILGQSGCGKTTMLNIIGGLDHYTSGDLLIDHRSTKDFKDKDWDSYRNHTIGFVFQSYNLIPHQSVLANVELALTLSGVSRDERRKRALEALEKVGLKDQIHKRPNQMSGGQMQRVAIARALVNNPDILLADEPTGALDSATSVAIMEILNEIAKDKLVIMVTHNPELAQKYSTRIIRLLDGEVVDDSNPYTIEEKTAEIMKLKKTSMSFVTALSLSLNNLMTKKARTFLTAFAGSIGIIGIALILSLSNGVQSYISSVEKETLSSYPITIQDNSMDMSVMMQTMMGMNAESKEHADDKIYSKQMINDIMETMSDQMDKNNLAAFKEYLDNDSAFKEHTKAIEYGYNLKLNVFNEHGKNGLVQVSPNQVMEKLGFGNMAQMQESFMGAQASSNNEVWNKLPENKTLREEEYTLLKGNWPKNYNEVVLAVDGDSEITDYALYSLGLLNQDDLSDNFEALQNGKEIKKDEQVSYTIDELLDMEFKLVLNSDLYKKINGIWIDMSDDEAYVENAVKNGETMKVVGIIQPKEKALSKNEMGGIYYTNALEKHVVEEVEKSDIVKEQKENKDTNVFTGTAFSKNEKFSLSSLSDEQKMQMAMLSQEDLAAYMSSYNDNVNATYESNLEKLGAVDMNSPSYINIYAKSFDDKEAVADLINTYNEKQEADGKESNVISYNDIVGTMMDSVTSIIDMISYVLMAFVSVSLIVSSIMIGIITYISVLERTKEIGILRAIGASKKDISRVFNAETFIIGLISGLIGIGITVALNIPISMIIEDMSGVANVSSLPVAGGIVLVLISLVLTIIAGLIPSRIASKKDPVEALRSE
ncbi:ATP-binding cassette domain-containing protein [Amedibacterium intestinale]|uniref:ABC transporter n=1 Tax=Amedibacterium intestinale TaxID=2583452 RepID=A0A6N4TLJ8_9FIRM|nr:ATP-binding cassette domain-containing protein [Amedibacterium intestinale]RHO19236.1 ATP-binding cassette domain-containing protein [Eubacterium sp. AM18-26]RHO22701.1 ATP-binding cassette domain-containing protein [Eubacterium sp. AM18-10LB-B]BBK23940.1 ABC transporter [Amedibacterium intestinale]